MTYIRILIAVSGLALLTACGGGGVTISAEDVATLEAELRKTKNAQRDAETSRDAAESARANAKAAQAEAERLRGIAETAMNNAVTAQLTADREITRLKNELATAIEERDSARGDKTAANLRITELEGELLTATSAKKSADAKVLRLTQELANVTRAKNAADAEVLRLTGVKNTAESERNTARDERDDALLAKGNADREITRLKKELNTAITERNSARGDKNTANLRIGELVEAARLAGIAKTDADTEIENLKEAARLAGIAKTDADTEIENLKEAARLAGIAKTNADTEIENLKEAARLAGIAKTDADTEIENLKEAARLAGIAKTDADTEIENLKEAARLAGIAKANADTEIEELKEAARLAGIAKTDADTEIENLKEAARLAGIAKTDADTEIENLKEAARLAGIAKTDADTEIENLKEAARLAGIAKANADTEIENLKEAARLAGIAKTDADTEIENLKEAARLAGIAKANADTEIENLKEAARLAGIAKANADTEIENLKEAARLAGIAKTDADTEIENLKEAARLAGIAKTDADTEIENLKEAARLAGIAKTDADTEIENLKEAARLAGIAKANADTEIENLKEAARLAGIAKDAADDKIEALEGKLLTATNDKKAADAEVLRLTGELEKANTEITRLDQFIRPTYANWKLAVNPETVPNTATPQNQFLQADEDSISTEGTTAGPNDVQTLNLLTATFDGLPLDGESADGVAFFQGQINGASYNYAGVFSGTDLGEAITDRAGKKAIWYGSFDHTLNPSKDFALTVIFNKIGGTLDAFVRAGVANNHFIFDDVRFDTRGLITGEVLYISFSQNGRTAITRTQTATLRGLIGDGEQGAVGVFVDEKGSNIGGGFVAHPTAKLDSNKINFADWGGVDGDSKTTVINKDNTDTDPLLYGVASVGNSNPAGNFIHGLAISSVANKGFNFVGTPFASATVTGDVLFLDEDRTSGVAFSYVRGVGVTGDKYYAGLLPTTDLGVPITAKDLSVTWDAQFTLNSNGEAFVNRNFKMRVRFNGNGGTIRSGTPAGNGFINGGVPLLEAENLNVRRDLITIAGRFGRDGVLYGTAGSGTLTGLIGVNGAVGAFVGATLAGGFVASPNAANTINSADWGGTAGNPKTTVIASTGLPGTEPLLNGFESVVNIGPRVNFIQGLPTLRGKGFKFAGTSFSDGTVYGDVLLLEEDSSSGVAFSHVLGTGVNGRKYYAGLLPGTTLGAPITDPNTDAIWDAQFRAVLGGLRSDTQEYSNPSFKMRITYNGIGHSTISSGTVSNGVFTKGSVTVPYTNITPPRFDGSSDFNIQGKFGDDGLLYGTVDLVGAVDIESTLTGLIGFNGAVGAFVGGGLGVNIAGGFVAYPAAYFADWAGTSDNRRATVINKDRSGTLPLLNGATSVSNANPAGNFIQRLATLDGQGFDFAETDFSDASVYGDVLYLDEDANSGSGVAFSHVVGTGVTGRKYYAGLLSDTDLGSRITDPNTSAIWDAKLKGVLRISGPLSIPQLYSNPRFKMQVIFDGSEGTISSGTYSGGVFTNGQISARFANAVTGSTINLGNFNIQGKFGHDGLLYGTVGLGSGTEGTLTGLIGVDGAVGAFAFASNAVSYAGGFVATPPE